MWTSSVAVALQPVSEEEWSGRLPDSSHYVRPALHAHTHTHSPFPVVVVVSAALPQGDGQVGCISTCALCLSGGSETNCSHEYFVLAVQWLSNFDNDNKKSSLGARSPSIYLRDNVHVELKLVTCWVIGTKAVISQGRGRLRLVLQSYCVQEQTPAQGANKWSVLIWRWTWFYLGLYIHKETDQSILFRLFAVWDGLTGNIIAQRVRLCCVKLIKNINDLHVRRVTSWYLRSPWCRQGEMLSMRDSKSQGRENIQPPAVSNKTRPAYFYVYLIIA